MPESRIQKFTHTIANSLDVVDDDNVLILSNEHAIPLVLELQKTVLERGAYPEIRINLEETRYNFLKYGHKKHLTHFPPGLAKEIEAATKLISIECVLNPNNLKNIPQEKINLWQNTVDPYYRRLDFIKTVVTIYPNVTYASRAGMSLAEYEDLFYSAVLVDMEQIYCQYAPIEEMLSHGHKFQIYTENSDLTFELGGRHFTMNSLLVNLPDGEIFCSPVEGSVNGHIRFEHPPSFQGKTFENLCLTFHNGEVIKYETKTEQAALEKLLATDHGSRRLGEFGIGINPAIPNLTNDILFDEKVAGTLHIAVGDSFIEVGGTNRSLIHFDMVKDMRGKGEIRMDGRVIYRDGSFCVR